MQAGYSLENKILLWLNGGTNSLFLFVFPIGLHILMNKVLNMKC